MEKLYPNRPYPVGALEYCIDDKAKRTVNRLKDISMLEFGECELIYDIPRLIGGGNIANLGHANGGSAMLMAKSLEDYNLPGCVMSVDVFGNRPESNRLKEALDTIKQRGLQDRIVLERGTTRVIGNNYKADNQSFDFIFIDADHKYTSVRDDFLQWSHMLKLGGWIAFHDTNQDFSHRVLVEEVLDNSKWKERKELHINRIRVFKKIQNDCIKRPYLPTGDN